MIMGLISSIWYKYLGGKKTPWADLTLDSDKNIKVKDCNKAFIDDVKNRHGDLTIGKSDGEIIEIFEGRENVKREEPKLEVLHFGISEDGRVSMKLDWNSAFISHLAKHGITGETEEEAVQLYLSRLSKQNSEDMGELTLGEIEEAFAELDATTIAELEAAAKQAAKHAEAIATKKPRRRKVNRTE